MNKSVPKPEISISKEDLSKLTAFFSMLLSMSQKNKAASTGKECIDHDKLRNNI